MLPWKLHKDCIWVRSTSSGDGLELELWPVKGLGLARGWVELGGWVESRGWVDGVGLSHGAGLTGLG